MQHQSRMPLLEMLSKIRRSRFVRQVLFTDSASCYIASVVHDREMIPDVAFPRTPCRNGHTDNFYKF